MRRIHFPLLFLAACGTPQEQCISRQTRDLRVVDRLIAETEGNLKRGYAFEEVTVWDEQWVTCPVPPPPPVAAGETPPPPPAPTLCLEEVRETVTRPKAIDLRDEAEKLAGLKDKRAELARAAKAVIAQCKAQYPE